MFCRQQVTNFAAGTESPNPEVAPAGANPPSSGPVAAAPAASTSTSKLKRFAGYMAHTRIGQSVMKSGVVKRLSEKVSNMPLVLTVELKALYGTMTVNFPPPPSGVVW